MCRGFKTPCALIQLGQHMGLVAELNQTGKVIAQIIQRLFEHTKLFSELKIKILGKKTCPFNNNCTRKLIV